MGQYIKQALYASFSVGVKNVVMKDTIRLTISIRCDSTDIKKAVLQWW